MERNMDREYPTRKNENYDRNPSRYAQGEERMSRGQPDWNRRTEDRRRDTQREDTHCQRFGFSEQFEDEPMMRGRSEAGYREIDRDSNRDLNARNYQREQQRAYQQDYPRTSSLYGSRATDPSRGMGPYAYGLGDSNYHDTYYGRPSDWDRGMRSEESSWWQHEGRSGYASQHNQDHEGLWSSVKNFFGVGPKGYRRSDARVLEDVCERLARHPGIDASEIEVDVKDGHVFLRGQVDSRFTKRRAEDVIEGIAGVEDVRNELTIKRADATGGKGRGDYTLSEGTNLYNGGNDPASRETAAMGTSGTAGTMGSVVNAGTRESEGSPRKNIQ